MHRFQRVNGYFSGLPLAIGLGFWFDGGMSGTKHVFEFVSDVAAKAPAGICPLFGGERFLQNLAVRAIRERWGGPESDFSISHFDGATCQWSDVLDELSTKSLFDRDAQKIVIVDDADSFVKLNRARLEDFLAKPKIAGLLVLVVDTWASNTKLYKQIEKTGTQIQCEAPVIQRGRGKQRDEAKIIKWLVARARQDYGFELPNSCATVLIELTECNFGRMDQELGKLCLYADATQELTPLEVKKIVGGWPAQTMWAAIDAALDGRAGQALDLLHQLFAAGEHPLAMFGQISWSLRRFAEVGELVQRDSRQKRRINMSETLKTAGFRSWGNEIESANSRLKQLGRQRVARILDWLVETDLALKRSHSNEERGRLKLELLFARMAEELSPARQSAG